MHNKYDFDLNRTAALSMLKKDKKSDTELSRDMSELMTVASRILSFSLPSQNEITSSNEKPLLREDIPLDSLSRADIFLNVKEERDGHVFLRFDTINLSDKEK